MEFAAPARPPSVRRISGSGPGLTHLTDRYYIANMETIMFKAPVGTKAKLRAINPNVSALLREQTEKLLSGRNGFRSAHDKSRHLCGVIQGGPKNVSTSKDYLKQYAPKRSH